MFLYHSSSDCVIVLVYVDDILVTGSFSSLIDKLLCFLHSEFALKDLGSLHYFLGIEALRTKSGLHLRQTRYITDLLHRVSMLDCKPLATPMATGPTLSLYHGTSLDNVTLYRSIVGALQYCTITRPDISFAVNKVCQFMHQPTNYHWLVVKRILRYLKGSLSHGIFLSAALYLSLSAFADSDWASCPNDRKSTSGYYVFLGSCLISWASSKQRVVF